ncbi:MAG: alanine--glyoxylate aminotransferase family protein [Nitrospinae bacterium]|nr:alanine--glyoxylate aminotransferase family protein [Nitrospinota bacterium]
MKKKYLLSPGPTPVPEAALLTMAYPMMHHRTPQFSAIFAEVKEDLKYLFQTKNDVLILASSGTGAMESAVVNIFSPGDHALVVNGGKFGERWGKICESYGLKTIWLNVEWGRAVKSEAIEDALNKDREIKGVFIQGNETSTAVSHPVREIAEIVRQRDNTLLIVDGITAVGVYDIPMDKWGIDVLITGSQKALMLPPGLSFISLNDKAWKFNETARLPRFYFDLKKERKNLKDNTTAYTPAASLIIGLREVLKIIKSEGLEKIFKKNERMARATRNAMTSLGLRLLAPEAPAECATGVYTPEGVDGGKLLKSLRDEFGVTLAGGQDQLKGKILRIAHMGYIDTFDIITAVASIEMALRKFGYKVELGRGVAAAQEVLLEGY